MLVGSLRKESFARKIARALIGLAPTPLALELVPIGDLALYNQDLDEPATPPAGWQTFRDRIRGAQGLLFVTPEYNRSVPGVMKNALDVGSRPPRKNIWQHKPGAVVSVTPGALGAFGANHHLRQSLAAVEVPVMPAPEAYISGAAKLFDEGGALTNDETRRFLTEFMQAYAAWVAVLARDD